MTDRRTRFDTRMDLRTLIEIVTLLSAIGAGYLGFQTKLDAMSQQISNASEATQRIEHYLSQKDPDYWKTISENGDNRR